MSKPIQEAVDQWGLPEAVEGSNGAAVLADMLDDVYMDRLKGGLGDKKKPSAFPIQQVLKGMAVEMEHTKDPLQALEIVVDHLSEDEVYYSKLEKIEAPKTG